MILSLHLGVGHSILLQLVGVGHVFSNHHISKCSGPPTPVLFDQSLSTNHQTCKDDTQNKSSSLTTFICQGSLKVLRVTLFGSYTAECLDPICNLQEERVTLQVVMAFILFGPKSWMF